jgi:hypothetical protein
MRAVGVAEGVLLGEPEAEDLDTPAYPGENRLALPLVLATSASGA